MISIKNAGQIELMRAACEIAASALRIGGEAVRPGITTAAIDTQIRRYILSRGAKPSFLGYGGFPASACISVNDEVIHGIPSSRKLAEGDIVSIDVGACFNGFHGDTAATFAVGRISDEDQRLLDVTKQALVIGMAQARSGNRIGDISWAVQQYVEAAGFSVVRKYVGHGVGRDLHEDPEVPNFGQPGHGPKLVGGMTIAIEPMVDYGGYDVKVLSNDWTVVTKDGSRAAHFEHTVLVTSDGGQPLTVCDLHGV